jgi:TolA-binding protein
MIVCSVLLLPASVEAQSGGRTAYLESRLGELQRTAAGLSAQLEQLRAQDRQLQQQMEKMQTSLGQRLERLEKGGAAKPVPRSSPSKR